MSTPAGVEDGSADLLFEFPQQGRADLVFGDSQHSAQQVEIVVQGRLPGLAAQVVFIPPSELTLAGTLPGLSGQVTVRLARPVAVVAVLPGLTVSVQAAYESNTSRPTVAVQSSPWEPCQRTELGSSQPQQSAGRSVWGWEAHGSAAMTLPHGVFQPLPPVQGALHRGQSDRFARGGACDHVVGVTNDQGMSTPQRIDAHFASAQALRRGVGLLYQEATRIRSRNPRSVWQNAQPLGVRHPSTMDKATALWRIWEALHQAAMRPAPGISRWVLPEPPPTSPCYTPSAHLLFAERVATGTDLLFACEDITGPPPDGNTVRVPVRRVYFVINNVTLHRLPDGMPVPVYNLSLSLDTASWTWGFDAQLPAKAEGLVAPGDASGPVELVASINGTQFRVLAESISRERSFGDASIRVSGRGRNAVLAAPYAPVMNFQQPQARTARQLMDDVLTLNGISLGWTVDWALMDWNVPAGVFARQGTWIEALSAIAGAAGGYLMPHPSDPTIRVRPLYPVVPWAWDTVTPDFVLPVDAVARESLRWLEKPAYNRVFVSGQDVGVLGQVTRTGTAGDVLAPMVVDALITQAAAARQRGLAVLADTGHQIEVSLRLPVLAETGIIEPGAFVEYQDGSQGSTIRRLGLVRSTQVEAGMPEVWQTLGVQGYA